MIRRATLMTCTLTGALVCLVDFESVRAQSCGQRGSASGLNTQVASPISTQLTGLQQPVALNQLAALQQQQAMTQAMRLQQEYAVLAARRQQEVAAQTEKRQNELAQRATEYRQLGDRFRAQERTALAIQNYRRAVAAAPGSRDAIAAQVELEAYQEEAEAKLLDVQHLISVRDWEQAGAQLTSLKRDYAKLRIGSRINAMSSRVARLKDQSHSASSEIADRSGRLGGLVRKSN